jgi:hypothetical protein
MPSSAQYFSIFLNLNKTEATLRRNNLVNNRKSLFAPFLQLARAVSSRGALRLQIFTSKMSEGGINFLKTVKMGKVGYEVRQCVNECAHKNRSSHAAAPMNKRSRVFGDETDFATSAPEPHSFERLQCMATPSPPRPSRTQRRSPVLVDLSASSVWNTQARRVLCVCRAALRSTEPWPRHLHGSSQPAAPPLNAMSSSSPP